MFSDTSGKLRERKLPFAQTADRSLKDLALINYPLIIFAVEIKKKPLQSVNNNENKISTDERSAIPF